MQCPKVELNRFRLMIVNTEHNSNQKSESKWNKKQTRQRLSCCHFINLMIIRRLSKISQYSLAIAINSHHNNSKNKFLMWSRDHYHHTVVWPFFFQNMLQIAFFGWNYPTPNVTNILITRLINNDTASISSSH